MAERSGCHRRDRSAMHSGHAGGSSQPGTGSAGLDGITPGESSPALLGGATLILLALPDVALTAPHVQSESPFCTRLNRLVWWLPVGVTRLAPDHTRDEVLGWALPLMLGSTMAAWALAYIVGFALVQLPFIHDPASFSLPGPRSNLENVLFFSGTRRRRERAFTGAPFADIVRDLQAVSSTDRSKRPAQSRSSGNR